MSAMDKGISFHQLMKSLKGETSCPLIMDTLPRKYKIGDGAVAIEAEQGDGAVAVGKDAATTGSLASSIQLAKMRSFFADRYNRRVRNAKHKP